MPSLIPPRIRRHLRGPALVARTAWWALVLILRALRARVATERRRRRRGRPRLVLGPTPLISLADWSRALRRLGYESRTLVTHHYPAHVRADFDVYYEDVAPDARPRARDYAVFSWALRSADVFLTFFDAGFLRETPLRRLEGPLWRLAGKHVIVSPYGADIAVPGYLGPFEAAMLADYPATSERAPLVRRRVRYWSRWSSLVVRNLQFGYLPCHDVFWPTLIAIDTDRWSPNPAARDSNGGSDEVTVVHSPNHRAIKGTDALVAAVEELRAEGLPVRLELIQGRPNEEVRRAVEAADVVAEQFLGGYALAAIEGMSAGKPVLSNLRWMPPEIRAHPLLSDCPIVDCDRETVKDELGRLVADADRRDAIGEASRRFVLERHSYDAVGEIWAALVEHVWRGSPLPSQLRPLPTSSTG